jgi:hypothetical protein
MEPAPVTGRPARPLRTLTIATLVLTAILALIAGISLYPEARYAFEPDKPLEIGALATAELSASLAGRYVRARVELAGKPAVAFHRFGESERRIALASQGPRFVEYAVPEGAGARFVPPDLVAGRLSRVGELGLRYRGLSRPLEGLAPDAATRGWVLVDGEEPKAAAWVAGVFALVAAFFLFCVVSLVRILRKRPSAA